MKFDTELPSYSRVELYSKLIAIPRCGPGVVALSRFFKPFMDTEEFLDRIQESDEDWR